MRAGAILRTRKGSGAGGWGAERGRAGGRAGTAARAAAMRLEPTIVERARASRRSPALGVSDPSLLPADVSPYGWRGTVGGRVWGTAGRGGGGGWDRKASCGLQARARGRGEGRGRRRANPAAPAERCARTAGGSAARAATRSTPASASAKVEGSGTVGPAGAAARWAQRALAGGREG